MSVTGSTAPFIPCIMIPCYNHGRMMPQVLQRLAPLGLPTLVVDDGSDATTAQQLDVLAGQYPDLTLLRLAVNQGKGAALLHAMQAASAAGYTHAVQVDADGQHTLEDVPALLAMARQHPDDLVSGLPIYDHSIPRARYYGRKFTDMWTAIETLSGDLQDSMCGFRVYPLQPTLALAARVTLGRRMDFDTEVMVRLYWQGHVSHFVPTRVTYPVDGLSHFQAVRDNVRISWMHTRLVFGMLRHLPALLGRRRRRHRHWAKTPELAGLRGMRLMLAIYRALGRRTFNALLYPVVAVYWLCAGQARQASNAWLAAVRQQLLAAGRPLPARLHSYHHFLRFGQAMLDKVASWQGDLRLGEEVIFAPGAEAVLDAPAAGGKLILASHLGDVEVCRALAQRHARPVIHALVFSAHAQRFRQIMEEVAPQSGVHLLPVTDIGPETAIQLKSWLEQGEWVAIVGDRIAVQPQREGQWRVIWSEFLGQPAPFPQGPFILAAALRCPIVQLFALRQQERLVLHCEPFADPLLLPRANRQAALQQAVDRYASRLAAHALDAPLDWFNFYNFWQLPAAAGEPRQVKE